MATVGISIDERRVKSALRTLHEKLADLSPVMRQLGEIVHARVMQNFEEGRSPEGTPWVPSQRALRTAGKTLIDKSFLRNSINVQPSSDCVRVGTPVVYGPVHQFGRAYPSARIVSARLGKSKGGPAAKSASESHSCGASGGIPARPFLGVRQSDWGEIRTLVAEYLVLLQ